MGVKEKTYVALLLFVAVFLISATESSGLNERNQEIRICKLECEGITGAGQDEKLRCKETCEEYPQEKQKSEREGGQGKGTNHGGGGGGSGDIIFANDDQDIPKMMEECQQICTMTSHKGSPEQFLPECFQKCMRQHFQEQGERINDDTSRPEKVKISGKQQQQSTNPFVFEDRHFTTRLETEQGNVRVLQKFTDRSDLFRGIEKYRVAFLEAEPQTFIIPNHWDADALFFVANGEGTITLINQDSRQTHNIKHGDIFRVPAGISAYLINRHNNERLVLAKILHSVSVPGELQTFFSVGGDNPASSFFNAFSTEVLEAAFDTDRDSIETLFGQRKEQAGIFKKATEEQIRSLTGQDEGRTWPFGERKSKGKGPYNIYKKNPSVANENGILHEVDSDDFSDLQKINVAFSFFNITQGSMAGPLYNTKATVVLVVPNGVGGFEMACPHLPEKASGGGGGFNPTYQKVTSELRRGTVVVIPAGHPVVIEASGNQNLEVIGFGLNSDVNEWFPLAGRDNVMSQWEDEAVELTFGVPAREAQKVIQKQNQKFFFKGPARRGRAFA